MCVLGSPTRVEGAPVKCDHSNVWLFFVCCQNDFLEDYDDQDRLHCYKENSQGPCEDGEKFIQLDEEDENGAQSSPICSTESPNFEIKTQILRFGKNVQMVNSMI